MSDTPESTVETAGERRAAALWRWGPSAAVLAVSVCAYRYGLVALDEGGMAHTADRLARGEVLYRDVATGVAPLAYYVLAALYWLLGPSLIVGRLFAAFNLAANTFLVQRIASRLVGERGAVVPALATAAVCLYGYRHMGYSPLAIGFHLASVLLTLRFVEGGRRTSLYGAGVALALCSLTKQNYGVLAILGALSGLLLLALARRRPRPLVAAFDRSLALAVGAAPTVLLVLLGFVAAGAADDMVRYGVQGPTTGNLGAFYKPYPLLDPARPFYYAADLQEYAPFPPATEVVAKPAPRTLFMALVLVVYLGAPAVLAASVVLLARRLRAAKGAGARAVPREGSEPRLEALAVIVPAACLLFLGVLPRSDYSHLALVLPLVLVVAADLGARLPKRLRAVGLVVAVLGTVASAAPPLLEIAGVGHAITPEAPLGLPRGRFIVARPDEVRTLRSVVEGLESRGRADDPILVVPRDPLVYFLSERPNASDYPLVLPGAFDLEPFARALEGVDTVVLRDLGHDALPLFELMPWVYSLLRGQMVVDDDYLAGLETPDQHPLFLLRRPDRAGGAVRDPLGGLELVPQRAGRPALTPRILNAFERVHVPRFEEEPRMGGTQWLLEPAVRLRPPSGWQKLAVCFGVTPREGSAFVFSLAHLPPLEGDRALVANRGGVLDGMAVEVWAWRRGGRRLQRLLSTGLAPSEWRWRPVSVDLTGFADRETVIVVAVSAGPTLDEVGDVALVGRPRVVGPRGERLRVERLDPASLPGAVIDELVRFTDVARFADGDGGWPAEARSRALRNRGLVEAGVGLERQALEHLDAALALAGEDLETLHAAAELALGLGDPEARERFDAVLERSPDHVRSLEMTARLALAADDTETARRRAERAHRLAPSSAEAALLLARLAIDGGRDQEAVDLLRPLAAGPPGGARQQALHLLGVALPSESIEIQGRRLSRLREPLAAGGHLALVEPLDVPMRRVTPGQPLRFDLRVTNRSAHTWPALGEEDGARRIALGYRWLEEGTGRRLAEGRLPLPADLAPGGTDRFRFEGAAPREPGRWVLVLEMLQEGVGWFVDAAPAGAAEPVRLSFLVREATP